jgi:hypothetical protein
VVLSSDTSLVVEYQLFGGTNHLHFYTEFYLFSRNLLNDAINKCSTDIHWIRWQCVPPKYGYSLTRLHGVIIQKDLRCRENLRSCICSPVLDFYYRDFVLHPYEAHVCRLPWSNPGNVELVLAAYWLTTLRHHHMRRCQRHHATDDAPKSNLPTGNNFTASGSEVLTAVVRKSSTSTFWYITPCSPSKLNWRFGGTCRLHLQGLNVRQARNRCESRWQVEPWFPPAFTLISCLAQDGSDMFLRNVSQLSKDYTPLYPRR